MRMTGATAQLAERMQKDPTENALKQITVHIAARKWTKEVLTMRDYVLVFKNGVEVGAMNFPDRKKPMLCIKNGERICGYGSFTSESHARDFMHLLAQLVQAKEVVEKE